MCNVQGPPLRKRKPQPLPSIQPYPIYLDYNATTPLCTQAWDAMCAVHDVWGNPSSVHPYGLAAKHALQLARQSIARSLNVNNCLHLNQQKHEENNIVPHNQHEDNNILINKIISHNSVHSTNDHSSFSQSIIFTSCGTQSNNLAIIGGALSVNQIYPQRRHIISTNIEHPAVAQVLKYLQQARHGANFVCHEVPVNVKTGRLDVNTLRSFTRSIDDGASTVALVSVMYANNEIGTVNDIASLVSTVKQECGRECLFHTDAAQSLGKVFVDVWHDQVDLLSVCPHKFYGPKGIAALYVRPEVHIKNISFGAGHEGGIRPGTENVLLVTGMARALQVAISHFDQYSSNMRNTRNELLRVLRQELRVHDMNLMINGQLQLALPNTLNCAIFKNVRDYQSNLPITFISAPRLILQVGDQVCMSAGSACHSTSDEETLQVSAPLRGIGVNLKRAVGTLRLSTGRSTTMSQVRRAARVIARHAAQQFAEQTTRS